jgi:hypothetical protein
MDPLNDRKGCQDRIEFRCALDGREASGLAQLYESIKQGRGVRRYERAGTSPLTGYSIGIAWIFVMGSD